GATVGPSFEPFGDAKKKNDGGGFGPLADDGGAEHGDDHQKGDVGLKAPERSPCAGKQKPTSRHDGGGEHRRFNRERSRIRPASDEAGGDQEARKRETAIFPALVAA